MIDALVLGALRSGPRRLSELQQQLQLLERLLSAAADRTGKPVAFSLPHVLERLHREGFLERASTGQTNEPDVMYALTAAGKQRLSEESARQRSVVSHFIEEADLDRSFRRFLDRQSAF